MPEDTYLLGLVHFDSFEEIDLEQFLVHIDCQELITDPRVLMSEEEGGVTFYLICDELVDLEGTPDDTTVWLYYFLNKKENGTCTNLIFHTRQPLNESQANKAITQIYKDIHI